MWSILLLLLPTYKIQRRRLLMKLRKFKIKIKKNHSWIWGGQQYSKRSWRLRNRDMMLLLIEQKKKELEQQRMHIDRARYELENKEVWILEAEPLIPIARQLQDLGTDINQFLPWIETIHEKAEAEKTNLISAAYSTRFKIV
jgi:hypothetical protein